MTGIYQIDVKFKHLYKNSKFKSDYYLRFITVTNVLEKRCL